MKKPVPVSAGPLNQTALSYKSFLRNTINGSDQSPNFTTFKEHKNRFWGINSASLCSLAGRYDNTIPTRFLAPIGCLKIPVLFIKKFTVEPRKQLP